MESDEEENNQNNNSDPPIRIEQPQTEPQITPSSSKEEILKPELRREK